MFLRTVAVLLAITLPASTAVRAQPISTGPNIVLILADDLGFSDIGCFGGEIATPNIDRLAKNGTAFTQFYNCARCCPTRASLLTGLYPHLAGVGDMDHPGVGKAYRGYIGEECPTIAECLKSAGYDTLMCGKWHVGKDPTHRPNDRGFDQFYGILGGYSSYFEITPTHPLYLNNTSVAAPANFYMTDALTDQAISFVKQYAPAPEPYFLYMAYTAPHWPVHALPDDIAKYKGKYLQGWEAMRQKRYKEQIELGIVDPKWKLSSPDSEVPSWEKQENKELEDLKMAAYAAQIDRLDQQIGRLLDCIAQTDAPENTLVIFLSDNGGCAEVVNADADSSALPGSKESFISYGRPWANLSNTPFRMYKHWVREGGIATPLIACWPGHIPAGRRTNVVGHVMDLMPTFLDLAGTQFPTHRGSLATTPLTGVSLVPILLGGNRELHENLFWEHEGHKAVRSDNWKLVSLEPVGWSLHDMTTDRTEAVDLADHEPQRVQQMRAAYDQWAQQVGVVEKH